MSCIRDEYDATSLGFSEKFLKDPINPIRDGHTIPFAESDTLRYSLFMDNSSVCCFFLQKSDKIHSRNSTPAKKKYGLNTKLKAFWLIAFVYNLELDFRPP